MGNPSPAAIGAVTPAVLLLVVAGCGHAADPPTSPSTQTATPQSSPTAAGSASTVPVRPPQTRGEPTQTPAAPPFRAAPAEVTALAGRFVRTVVEYDSAQETKLGFLARLRGLVTPAGLSRLAHSPRARLSWRVLRARSERTSLDVDGVTLLSSTSQRLRVVVAATVTTHTTFATVSGFRQYTLTLAPAAGTGVWLVDRAEGIDP